MNVEPIISIFEGVFGKGNVIYDASLKDFQTGKGVVYFRISDYSKTGDVLRVDGSLYKELPDNKSPLSLFDLLQRNKADFRFTTSKVNNNESYESVEYTVLIEDEKIPKEKIEIIEIIENGNIFTIIKNSIKKITRSKK